MTKTKENNQKIEKSHVATEILRIAANYGCTAQITMVEVLSKNIGVRNGEIENLLTSTAISTGVRLFKDQKSTIIAFSGEDFGNLDFKIKAALENLPFHSENPDFRLLMADEFSGSIPQLQLSDGAYEQLNINSIVETLKLIENSALRYSSKVTAADMAEFTGSYTRNFLWTSNGVNKSYQKTSYAFSYVAVAQEGENKERDSYSENKRFFSDFPPLHQLGRVGERAAERALKRLGGKKIPSGVRPVVFSYRTAGSLLELLCDALDGEALVVKNSFLLDQLGETLFPEKISVFDDPLIDRYRGSYPFDGEGKNGITKAVIEKGKLQTYLHNSYSAAKLKMALTGNASLSLSSVPHVTVGNFYLQSGQGTLDDLVHVMKEGLVVDDLYVSGMNAVTGDFSFGCSGFLVENGVMTMPVREITIGGNLLDLYKNVVAIADDNQWKATITSPSILVSKLTIGGI